MSHYLPTGTVYGTLLNFTTEWDHWAERMTQPPYKAAPKAPVLYVKTSNTFQRSGEKTLLDDDAKQVYVGAGVGLIIGADGTPDQVVLLNDFSTDHDNYYRTPIKGKNRDGFLTVGEPLALDPDAGLDAFIGALSLDVIINGEHQQTVDLSTLRRPPSTLLTDIAEFMTLQPGDVLLLGTDCRPDGTRPLVKAGDHVEISANGLASLTTSMQAGGARANASSSAKHRSAAKKPGRLARVVWGGAIHEAREHDEGLILTRGHHAGRVLALDDVQWLPPLAPVNRPRTVLALGLNYADHARELAFKPPEEPMVFIKSGTGLIGHKGATIRPAGIDYMHYECELAVVIGKTARNVSRQHAYNYIQGYCVANDYAIRDYLENWFRPNLRVKNRDTGTPLGPWLVDAEQIDPMNLALKTTVNGEVTQQGSTRDMIFDVPGLIEYFSQFMTLQPGDLILTGTPDGIVDCKPGDTVITEVEGLGALVNHIVAPPARQA